MPPHVLGSRLKCLVPVHVESLAHVVHLLTHHFYPTYVRTVHIPVVASTINSLAQHYGLLPHFPVTQTTSDYFSAHFYVRLHCGVSYILDISPMG